MELTPTLILNLALLIVPPVALVLVFWKWLTRHIRWTVALTALCDVLLFWDELFYTAAGGWNVPNEESPCSASAVLYPHREQRPCHGI